MKIKRLLAIAGLAAAGTAIAGGANFNTLFVFDGGTGVQPLRAGATANTVAGVAPGGAPWLIREFDAVIKKNGDIRAHGEGVLLAGTDNLGTRAGPSQGHSFAVLPQCTGSAGRGGYPADHALQLRPR